MDGLKIPYTISSKNQGGTRCEGSWTRNTNALYVKGRLFVTRIKGDINFDSIVSLHDFFIGEDADREYEQFMRQLGPDVKPQKTQVPGSVLAYAEAVNSVKKPSKEVNDFFDNLDVLVHRILK